MHTKGEAAKKLKKQLRLDTCIYLGNDLNDISMFSNAIDDNDFIVIANHEHKDITEMLVNYLRQECEVKGIPWEDTRLLVLEEENVNNFLNRTSKILGVLNSKRKSEDVRETYKVNVVKSINYSHKRRMLDKRKRHREFHR